MADVVYPSQVPDEFHAGDSFLLELSGGDYPPPEWTASIVLSNSSVRNTAAGTSSGSLHRIDIAPATTSNWATGSYSWQIYAEKTGYRVTLASGNIKILANIGDASQGNDVRNFPRTVADALESIIQNRATKEQLLLAQQSVGDLNVNYVPDVMAEWQKWNGYAEQLENANKVSAGMGGPRAIYARFQ